MKNKNKKESAKEVLIPEEQKTVEQSAPAKTKKKRYHKKQKQTVIDTPIIDIVIEKEELTPIKPKLNWFQIQYNSFVKWYNS